MLAACLDQVNDDGIMDRLFSPGVLDVTHRLLFSHHGATPVKLMDQKNNKGPITSYRVVRGVERLSKYYFLTYNFCSPVEKYSRVKDVVGRSLWFETVVTFFLVKCDWMKCD